MGSTAAWRGETRQLCLDATGGQQILHRGASVTTLWRLAVSRRLRRSGGGCNQPARRRSFAATRFRITSRRSPTRLSPCSLGSIGHLRSHVTQFHKTWTSVLLIVCPMRTWAVARGSQLGHCAGIRNARRSVVMRRRIGVSVVRESTNRQLGKSLTGLVCLVLPTSGDYMPGTSTY